MTTSDDRYWLLTGEVPAGPFDVEQVHAELSAGRASWQTPACRLGDSVWRPLIQMPEFGPPAPSVPHTPPTADTTTGEPAAPAPAAASSGAVTTRRRSWLSIGMASVLVVGVAVVVTVMSSLGLIRGQTTPATSDSAPSEPAATTPTLVERLTFAPGREILYTDGLRTEAERLGRALDEAGYAEGKWPARVQLSNRGKVWVVEMEVSARRFDDPTEPAALERWVGVPVAAVAFPGEPMEMRVFETGGPERVRFRVDRAARSRIGQSASAVYSLGGAGAEGERLAAVLDRLGLHTRVRWVVLLARDAGGWVITPLNLRPVELAPAVRLQWTEFARAAGQEFSAAVRVDVLADDYALAESLRPAAVPTDEAEEKAATALRELGVTVVRDEGVPGRPVVKVSLYSFRQEHTAAKLKLLAPLKHLATLDLALTDGVTDAEMKDLAPLSELTTLDLSHTQVTDAGVKELAPLSGLVSLRLAHTRVTDAGVKELARLGSLSELDLSFTRVTDAGLKELGPLDRLTTLALDGQQVTVTGVKALASLRSLTTLRVSSTRVWGMEALASLRPLTTLHLTVEEVSGDELKELAALTNLTSLSLHRTQVTDAGLKELHPLKNLAALDLSGVSTSGAILSDRPQYPGSKVSDAGVKELASLKALAAVDLSYTRVTDAGLKELAPLGGLTTLKLNHTGVTDEGLKELANFKRLTHVELTGSLATDAGAKRLQAAMPKCKVVR